MRLVFGIIIGAALTIESAYVFDSQQSEGLFVRPMVNWDAVSKNWRQLHDYARIRWADGRTAAR